MAVKIDSAGRKTRNFKADIKDKKAKHTFQLIVSQNQTETSLQKNYRY